jgi:hypothetical protein
MKEELSKKQKAEEHEHEGDNLVIEKPIPFVLSDFKISVSNKERSVNLEFSKSINSNDLVILINDLLRDPIFERFPIFERI